MIVRRILILLSLCLIAPAAVAHTVPMTQMEMTLKSDGTYTAFIIIDSAAFLFDSPPGTVDNEVGYEMAEMTAEQLQARIDSATKRFHESLRIEWDGEHQPPSLVQIQNGRELHEELKQGSPGQVPLFVILMDGKVPVDPVRLSIRLPEHYYPASLQIHIEGDEFPLLQLARDRADTDDFQLRDAPTSWSSVVWDYLVLGFEHIIPHGLDHILFVLGLFLLSDRIKPLLWQVTAFTVAHTCTLALSMMEVVQLPASIVEPLIALSIAYVAIENVATKKLHAWRPGLVFAFGLLHGLGFAGVLREIGMPHQHFVSALISFNVGVEVGQLAVIAAAFAMVGWFAKRDWYRPAITIPASIAIAVTGLYWTVERVLG